MKTESESALIGWMAAGMRSPGLRTLSQFAEDEIILPSGPFQGRRFNLSRSPAGRLLFRELENPQWHRAFITGPNQDGKSLLGFVIPTLYLLFERKETVILGVPSLDIVTDKWRVDLQPVIEASRYRQFLPTKGPGSGDGESISLGFTNGARLRFMTAGGNDQSRAGFASRNLVVTETDGFDVVGGNSREGDKLRQLERRSLAFGDDARMIAECTVSTEKGRTWQEYLQGSHSRIALPCPHCSAWVTPEREHFVGWQNALTKLEAVEKAAIACPACGAEWTNDQRIAANHSAKLLHKGQTVGPAGEIVGDLPQTDTLGFRWTVANSVLDPRRLSRVAGIEWTARRAADEEAAERDVCQSQWTLPAKPSKADVNALDINKIMARTLPTVGRGVCPEGTQFITVGCDVGQYRCHWTALAWRPNATPHAVDYGVIEVPPGEHAPEISVLNALREWRDEVANRGWPIGEKVTSPVIVFVDSGWNQDTILLFAAESGEKYFGTKGYGILQRRTGNNKRDTGTKVIASYDGYAALQLPSGARQIEVNSDRWKSWLHSRIRTKLSEPGAFTLFAHNDHFSFCKHLTAEVEVEEFVATEGMVTRWEARNRNNHWLDATTLACVAGHAAGARLIDAPATPPPPPSDPKQFYDPNAHRGRW